MQGEEEGRRRRPARRPQGLLGRGQPISLSLINSSRGDCNTAGDCWGKKKRWRERAGEERWRGGEKERDRNEWEGVEGRGGQSRIDEGKIGKGEKMGGGKRGVRKGGGQKIGKDKREEGERGRRLIGGGEKDA